MTPPFDGPPADRYPGLGDRFLTPLNREPIPMVRVTDDPDAPLTSGPVRFIVPLGSVRLVTKVTVRFMPDDQALNPFPNLRVVQTAQLWMALRDRNRGGNEGHVVGVRNVVGAQSAPELIPSPGYPAATAAGLCGHGESFGGSGVIFPVPFLGPLTFAFAPTGIFDEVIGELTITNNGAPGMPTGGWYLQTRWEPATSMHPEEWSQMKSLLDPRVGQRETPVTNISGG